MKNKVFILGCGNPLFGDDGFGPAVIDYLKNNFNQRLTDDIQAIDMGTAVRDFLFDIVLSKEKPKKIIIIDAQSENISPGEIKEIPLDNISSKKISDFSLHQFPTTNLLKELKQDTQIDIKIFVVGAKHVPDKVKPGLSKEVKEAIPKMCEIVLKECEV